MKWMSLPALALLSACVTTQLPQGGPVAIDQTAAVGPLRITPIALVEDSRCPENARCVWAGRAVVRVTIERGPNRIERNLTLGEPAVTDLGRIMLDSATPDKMAGKETPLSSYRFHFSALP